MASRIQREKEKIIATAANSSADSSTPPLPPVPMETSSTPTPSIMSPSPVACEIPSGSLPAAQPPAPPATSARRPKKLNLFTVKLHFLGDYVRHIRLFGTTDSYSTQLGELAHRLLKAFYALTNKKEATKQMAKKYERLETLRTPSTASTAGESVEETEAANSRLDIPYYISHSRRSPIDIGAFIHTTPMDPSKRLFIPSLQNHILGRLTGRQFDGDDMEDFTDEQRNLIRFLGNRIYRHATFRVNYTTYDMCRAYDTINPRTRPFIMMASPEKEGGAHPFWYASVMGVFHAEVQQCDARGSSSGPQEIEFLWVRWLGVEPGYKFGRKAARLPKIGFVPESDDYAFGFVDPSLVLRGCHLIPAFAEGRTQSLLSTREATEARPRGESDDWMNYYVGIFVDRDMLMRHLGMGIGHVGQTNYNNPSTEGELESMEDIEEDEGEDDILTRLAKAMGDGEDDDDNSDDDKDEDDEDVDENEDDEEFESGDLGFDEF